jgi:transcriptional regulator of acetoin/glycerol metabolism
MNSQTEKAQFLSIIEEKLIKTGEKDKLKEHLRQRLIEHGWKEDLKAVCKQVLLSKSLDRITVDDLVAEITPHARDKIPETVRQDLLAKIRKFLQEQEQ